MAPSLLHMLTLLCLCGSSASVKDKDNYDVQMIGVGKKATIHCSPQKMPQDGAYLYKQLLEKEKVSYLYKDGTFSPKGLFPNRLESNNNLHMLTVSILNLTVWDTGVYWCQFNKEDKTSDSTRRTLLVVSAGQQTECPKEKEKEETYMLLIIVCIAAAFIMLLITIILLWAIPKVKHCCEHGQFAPPHHQGNGVYEEMRGRRVPASHTLINSAYQPCTRHMGLPTTETNY